MLLSPFDMLSDLLHWLFQAVSAAFGLLMKLLCAVAETVFLPFSWVAGSLRDAWATVNGPCLFLTVLGGVFLLLLVFFAAVCLAAYCKGKRR